MKKPRDHHYTFAYEMLPKLFFSDPSKFIEMISTHKDDYVYFIWKSVGEKWINNDSDIMTPNGLSCAVINAGDDITVAIVKLPPPEVMPEAYFVAMVYNPPNAQYITLEKSLNLEDGSPSSVLCGLAGNEMHFNYGGGPSEPTFRSFYDAVIRLIKTNN